MLHLDIFYDTIQKSLKKLAQDESYPEKICSQFSNFRMSCFFQLTTYLRQWSTPVMETLKSFIQSFAKFLGMLKIVLEVLISIAQIF